MLSGLMLVAVLAVDPLAPFVAGGRAAAIVAARREAQAAGDAEHWKRVGLVEFRSGLPQAAARSFGEAARLDPASLLLRFNLASALFESRRFAEAEARYLEAADDAKLAPLALVNAALAARAAGALDRALAHARRAEARSREPEVHALVAELREAKAKALHARLYQRLGTARAALGRRDFAAAIAELRGAADEARAGAADPADRAEVDYALGRALDESGDLAGAESAFERAVAAAPDEADFRLMLATVRARRKLERPSRWAVDARIGAGYDSNVPQSQIVVTTPSGAPAGTAAFQLTADLDVLLRAAGSARNGVSLEYRFGQLAYLSRPLDLYSLQEHDLVLAGAWTPHERVTLEAVADGFVLFSGVLGFSAFQGGASLGARAAVRLGRGVELRFKYLHSFKRAIDPSYYYLSGNHDDAEALLVWHNARGRVTLGYLFQSERVGAQYIPTEQIFATTSGSPNPCDMINNPALYDIYGAQCFKQYVIPYSYYSNEVSARGAVELGWRIRGALLFRYEHRNYTQQSYLEDINFEPVYRRTRIDDRYTVDVALKRPLGRGFEVELGYTLVVNRSTIDSSSLKLDYDNKNYVKHLGVIELGYLY